MHDAAGDVQELDRLAQRYAQLTEALRTVIVGQHEVIEQLLVAVFCEGHTLLVGVPGLAKTLLVRTLASALSLDFKRIQFTPDMMPSDILGAELLQSDPTTGSRSMHFMPGPIFANIVLADEINRTPPKTQAALLEAMAERQVSIAGRTIRLQSPFIVVATQNPIEQEGTYPLPEAQLDRFMFGLRMTYPKATEERRIVAAGDEIAERAALVQPLFGGEELARLRRLIGQVPVSEYVVEYAVALARSTRPGDEACPASISNYISWGAGPRAGQALILASRCLAVLEGEPTPSAEHVRRLAPAVLRHRLVLNYTAASEGVDTEQILDNLLRVTKEPDYR